MSIIELAAERRKFAFDVYVKHLSTPMLMPHLDKASNPGKSNFINLLKIINAQALTQTPEEMAWLQTAIEVKQKIWIWSDLHFNHANIIKYCSRPFSDVNEMNNALLSAAQSVPKDDLALIVGDFAMGRAAAVQTLWDVIQPCRLIVGNHDQDVWKADLKFPWADAIQVFFHEDREYWVTHYPIRTEMIPENVINIHGHIHDKLIEGKKHINVSVEIMGYKPNNLTEVINVHSITDTN